jgi:hypothetical protein
MHIYNRFHTKLRFKIKENKNICILLRLSILEAHTYHICRNNHLCSTYIPL